MAELNATAIMLRSIPFFDPVPEPALNQIAPQFHILNLRRGEQLAGRGFQNLEHYQDQVYFVHKGVLASFTVTKQNCRKILFFLGPGNLLNHNIFHTRPTAVFAEAMTDTILLTTSRERFCSLLQDSPALTAALLAHYETDLWRMSHQLKNTAGYVSVERKLAIKLLKLSQQFGLPEGDGLRLSFPLTVTQVAEFVGVPRETASRACKKLGEMGLIRYENKHFYITDREHLVAYYREPGTQKEDLV